jgi:mRNA-degrading endonuclease toxin of MazEF toxin-antitoxin module
VTAFLRGFVYWAHMDKRRPVIVVSHDARNKFGNDVVIVPCTTNMRPLGWHIVLAKGEGGLPWPSIAKCEQLTTVRKADLEQVALGPRLSTERIREIERAILSALAITAA